MQLNSIQIILFLIICIIQKINSCNTCEARNFEGEIKECICQPKQYCNESLGICVNCGDCFHFWETRTEKNKNNIANILESIVKKYKVNLNELDKLLSHLIRRVQAEENESNKQEKQLEEISKNFNNINKTIENVKKDLEKVRKQIENWNLPTDVGDILDKIREIKTKIDKIFQKIKAERINMIDKNKLNELIEKLRTIHYSIETLNQDFPELDPKNPLNLVLSTESDIFFLEKSIGSSRNTTKLPENIKSNMAWIELELLLLIDLLKSYQNFTENTDEVLKNATKIRSAAEATNSKLIPLLEEEERLSAALEKERTYYEIIERLLKTIQENEKILDELRPLQNALRKLRELQEELLKYQNELENFTEKVNSIDTAWLDKLLKEENEVLQEYKSIPIAQDISSLDQEINQMIEEINSIIKDIENHCKINT